MFFMRNNNTLLDVNNAVKMLRCMFFLQATFTSGYLITKLEGGGGGEWKKI